MSERFAARQWVPFPCEFVFAFFANPHNLPRLMPPELKTRIEKLEQCAPPALEVQATALHPLAAAGIGSTILISFCPLPRLPFRVRWLARIGEFMWNSHFCDEQVQGPFAQFRHCHGTQSQILNGSVGTLVSDDIEYELPFGAAGRLASAFVQRQLQRSFAGRQARLPELLADAAETAGAAVSPKPISSLT
jgi:ligand-binding SRPBCC domain-containing protein